MPIASPRRRMPTWAFVLICFLSSLVGLFAGGIFGAAISDLAGLPSSIIALAALAGTFAPPAWLIVARRNGDTRCKDPSLISPLAPNGPPSLAPVQHEASDVSFDQDRPLTEGTSKIGTYRIIDWWRIGKASLNYLIFLVFGLMCAGAAPRLLLTALGVGTILFVLWMIAHLMGIVFDLDGDQLHYPSFILRRSIPLSGITDANAQVVVRSFMSTLANNIGSGPKSRPDKQYAVNLSGDFGTRQVRFASRKRRDQFLSIVRRFAPRARITRWTDWA